MRNLTAGKVFVVRMVILALLLAGSLTLSRVDLLLLAVAFLFAHYPLAIFFALRRMAHISRGWRVWRSLIFIFGLSFALLYLDPFNWGLYFSIHHALTEAFLLPDENLPENTPNYFPRGFVEETLRVTFHLCIYCFAVRDSFNFDWLRSPWLIVSAGLSFLALCFFYPKKSNWFHLGFAWTPLVLSLFAPVYFYHILLYHVLLWIFLPPVAQYESEPKRTRLHLALNCGLSLIFILTLFAWADPFRYETWEACQPFLLAGTYIHITSSFALSSLNPLWVRRAWA